MKWFLFFLILFVVSGFARAAEIRFVAYNVENYLQSIEESDGHTHSKPESARAALVQILREIQPDILGISEMGTPADFAEFRQRLEKAGLHFPYAEYVQASDPERHLALLSRFSIVARDSKNNVPFEINGLREKVRRGLLDVTIEVAHGQRIRFIGAHLKSKLPIPENEAVVRRDEAHLMRQHIDLAISETPEMPLVVYGDFNTTKNDAAIHEIVGVRGSPGALSELNLADNIGDHWTEYWKTADLYSRIDYICVNRILRRKIDFSKSYIYRSPYWNRASDHRPLVATIRID